MGKPSITDVRTGTGPVVLLILDGWGLSASWTGNAITQSEPPTFSYLWKYYPHAVLQAVSPALQQIGGVGSSETGHASLGAGRFVEQDLMELSTAIEQGEFFQSPSLMTAFDRVAEEGKAVHLIGLLSDGGIHADHRHAHALIRFARQRNVKNLYIHPILDGRDVESRSAGTYLDELSRVLAIEGVGEIATVAGRNYAMDRANNWDLIAKTYEALVFGYGPKAATTTEALALAYQQGLSDEYILPTVIGTAVGAFVPGRIHPGDVVVTWNARPDRLEELTRALLDRNAFRSFPFRRRYPLVGVDVVTMTDYHLRLPRLSVAFPAAALANTVGELLANHDLTQLRIAESEKRAHVTYFFNGGRADAFAGEDHLVVPSPRTASYASQPTMNAAAVTRIIERALERRSHRFIVANFANVDAVAHTGDLAATQRAVLVVDEAMRRVANAVIGAQGTLLVTADHGNGEAIRSTVSGNREVHHTANPVPFIYVSATTKTSASVSPNKPSLSTIVQQSVRAKHTIADVAPTILELFGLSKPTEMTGSSLLSSLL